MANEYILKDYKGSSIETTLSNAYSIANTSLTVASGSTFPDGSSGPFVVVISRGLADEEKMLIGSRISNTLTILEKGYDGTTSQNHPAGSSVNHCLDAYTLVQANRYANLQTTKGDLIARSASTTVRLPVGTNDYALVADSAATNGLAWKQIVAAGIATGAVTSAKILDGTIVNDDINASAAIALSKLGVLTGYASGAGLVANTDSILQAIQKLNGNDATNANLTGMVTSVGNATTVVTNANLTGDVTSLGNATTIALNAVTTGKIALLAVDTAQLATSAVTNSKINDDAVQTSKIKDATVTGPKIYKKIQNFSGPNYTVTSTDWILSHITATDVSVTLPDPAIYEGRSLQFRNTVPNVISSATNVIVALTSAGTPRQVLGVNLILSGTDGAWCELVSNGQYWLIVNASELT